MLFGQYLTHIGAVRPDDVLAALDDQDRRVERFGRIAVKNRLLTPAQLLRLLDAQIVHRRKLGETAIAFGYLNADQVTQVLIEQKEQRRPIGALLVERGAIDENELQEHLSRYFALEVDGAFATSLSAIDVQTSSPMDQSDTR